MILKKIQDDLKFLYQISLTENVEHYLTTSKTSPHATLIGSQNQKETLLVRQTNNDIELALYFSPEILHTLNRENPYKQLTENNFEAFTLAVEGGSHFNYLVWRADHDQSVTQLELELQAEIDKYILITFLFLNQQNRVPAELFQRLFENFQFHPTLTTQEKNRYTIANRLAQKFCAYLQSQFIQRGLWRNLLQHARQFYHLNHWQKFRYLTP